MKKTLFSTLAIAALMSSAPISSQAQELIVNGGFESNSFAGFVLTESSGNTSTASNGPMTTFAREGMYYAYLATGITAIGEPSNIGSLSYTFATTPGVQYTFSFSLASDVNTLNPGTHFFEALFNGTSLVTRNDAGAFSYLDYQFSGANLIATGNQSTIEFRYRHDDDGFRLDAVSVVPEPSTISLVAIAGLGGIFLVRRSRQTRKALLAEA